MLDSATWLGHSAICAQARATHEGLQERLATLRADGCTSETSARWASFEAALLHYLRAEDELLLPAFDLDCYADAARVRSEHNRIRALLLTIATGIGAQRLDEAALDALGQLLDRSFQFEEARLFPWAQRCLRPRRRGEFQQRMWLRNGALQPVDGSAKRGPALARSA
jgi:hypothetical protein